MCRPRLTMPLQRVATLTVLTPFRSRVPQIRQTSRWPRLRARLSPGQPTRSKSTQSTMILGMERLTRALMTIRVRMLSSLSLSTPRSQRTRLKLPEHWRSSFRMVTAMLSLMLSPSFRPRVSSLMVLLPSPWVLISKSLLPVVPLMPLLFPSPSLGDGTVLPRGVAPLLPVALLLMQLRPDGLHLLPLPQLRVRYLRNLVQPWLET